MEAKGQTHSRRRWRNLFVERMVDKGYVSSLHVLFTRTTVTGLQWPCAQHEKAAHIDIVRESLSSMERSEMKSREVVSTSADC